MNEMQIDAVEYAWAVLQLYARPFVPEDAAIPDVEYADLFLSEPTREAGAHAIFSALAHDVCHFIAEAHGASETSRRGQWHNRSFATIATNLGFPPMPNDPTFGSARLSFDNMDRPASVRALQRLADAFTRESEPPDLWPVPMCRSRRIIRPGKSGEPAVCKCGTTIRIAIGAFHRAGIRCEKCGELFQLKERAQ